MFDDFRVVTPQLAMSAGTVIASSLRETIRGKHSSLGPIDPHISGMAAHGIIEEFVQAKKDINANGQAAAIVWQPIIAQYSPTLIGACTKAIDWSNQIVELWLKTGMFKDEAEGDEKANRVVKEPGDHALNKSHARHLLINWAKECGLKMTDLEENQEYQDAALAVHHSCIQTIGTTNAFKIIENHNGIAFIQSM